MNHWRNYGYFWPAGTCESTMADIFLCSSGLLAPTSLSNCCPSLRKKKVGVAFTSHCVLNSCIKIYFITCTLCKDINNFIMQLLLQYGLIRDTAKWPTKKPKVYIKCIQSPKLFYAIFIVLLWLRYLLFLKRPVY